jgi:light-regulated signal transduction histidine kinase (bacteriophytochrome)
MLQIAGHENEIEERLDDLRNGRRVQHDDSVRRRSDGSPVQVSISMSAIRDTHGTLIGASKMVRDITDRKRTEAELAAAKEDAENTSRDFEAFSYSVAHDLRAPLRAIDAFSQILAEEYASALDQAGQDYLNRVRDSAQRMSSLIESMLNLAQITHQDLQATRVDLSALATGILDRLRQDAPERAIEWAIEPGLSALGDATLLANALENLFTNAWKFTRDRPDARIEFGHDDAGYFVRDNGAGFDMAYSPKLFGAFQRLHTQQEFAGTGIGLATVQRIIRRHGGQIQAEAAPGQGATFHFTLAQRKP